MATVGHDGHVVTDKVFGGGRVFVEMLQPDAVLQETAQSVGLHGDVAYLLQTFLFHLFRLSNSFNSNSITMGRRILILKN